MKKIISVVAVVILGISAYYFAGSNSEDEKLEYKFAEITKGKITNIITSSGTLNPVKKVEVGTQVSGRIEKIFVDYNSVVKKNQLLAILDTTFLSITVRDAKSQLLKAEAQYEEAKAKFELNKKLYEKAFISELDFINSKTAVKTAESQLQSAKSALEKAKTNLNYAFIKSPIDGVIIQRNVEQGQTVAASLQAPTLFLLAESLVNMEIRANVDESDIGSIKKGQKVKFTVQTYDDMEFDGVVREIWLQPETISNVVNYTVVIDAKNEEGLLLPGMTATVDFYVEEKENVLVVPNSALRFTPNDNDMEKFRSEMKKRFSQRTQNEQNAGNRRRNFNMSEEEIKKMRKQMGQVWFLDEEGNLKIARFRKGSTDGKNTEVLQSRILKEGIKVITGYNGNEKKETKKNNFMPPGPGFGRRM